MCRDKYGTEECMAHSLERSREYTFVVEGEEDMLDIRDALNPVWLTGDGLDIHDLAFKRIRRYRQLIRRFRHLAPSPPVGTRACRSTA